MCADVTANDASDEWFRDSSMPWWGLLAKRILQVREMPKHVAFVMDGNRRYARRNNLQSVIDGHSRGFDQMTKVLDWCRELGAKEVTIYAFSTENFQRDKDEVSGLMKMAETKFLKLLEQKDKLVERGICFRFFGDMSLLPERIQELTAKIESLTSKMTNGYVNVCLAYTSQNEIARAMEWIRLGVQSRLLTEKDIDSQLISSCLDSRHSLPVDLLIRTSGEHRLSDFLLWQCSNCYIYFENVLWPDMSFWHLFKAIVGFQRNRSFSIKLNSALKENCVRKNTTLNDERVAKFLCWMDEECEKQRSKRMEKIFTENKIKMKIIFVASLVRALPKAKANL